LRGEGDGNIFAVCERLAKFGKTEMISALEMLIGRCLCQAEEEARYTSSKIRHAAADQSIASQEKERKGEAN